MQGAQVQSLVRELRSHNHIVQPKAKKKKKTVKSLQTAENLNCIYIQITEDPRFGAFFLKSHYSYCLLILVNPHIVELIMY